MKKNGYILLETVICLGLLSIILFSANLMIFNLSKASNKLIKNKNQLENIYLAHRFLVNQILSCDRLMIETEKDFTLNSLKTYIWNDKENKHISYHTFEYLSSQKELRFGGETEKNKAFNNELAKNISDIKIYFDQETKILKIKIEPEILNKNSRSVDLILYLKNKEVSTKP